MGRQRNQISRVDSQEDFDHVLLKIEKLCQEQFPIINRAFPSFLSMTIQYALVERLFQDSAFGIQAYLEKLLRVRTQVSEYLEMMCYSYHKITKLGQRIYKSSQEAADDPRMVLELSFVEKQITALFVTHRQHFLRHQLESAQTDCEAILHAVVYPTPEAFPQSTSEGGGIMSPFSRKLNIPFDPDLLANLVDVGITPETHSKLLQISEAALKRSNVIFHATETGAELSAKIFQIVCTSLLVDHCGVRALYRCGALLRIDLLLENHEYMPVGHQKHRIIDFPQQ